MDINFVVPLLNACRGVKQQMKRRIGEVLVRAKRFEKQ
jgi:hypothetical protein